MRELLLSGAPSSRQSAQKEYCDTRANSANAQGAGQRRNQGVVAQRLNTVIEPTHAARAGTMPRVGAPASYLARTVTSSFALDKGSRIEGWRCASMRKPEARASRPSPEPAIKYGRTSMRTRSREKETPQAGDYGFRRWGLTTHMRSTRDALKPLQIICLTPAC